jgi:NitT/TauT family transport system ATP-binding protein
VQRVAEAAHNGEAPPAIAFSKISVAYPLKGGGRYVALGETDLVVADGEFTAIVGPTGCGKSTLLNVAAGLVPAASGGCAVFGKPLQGLNRDAGYLFQADPLMPWKTARDNIAVGLSVRGMTGAEARDRAQSWLARVGLSSMGDRYPHQLSGGQKKRVALAQMLILEPKLLLMDEPFGPLDAQTRIVMGDLLLSLWSAERKAVLFVTHDLEEAIALADRVVVLSAGPQARIIADHRVGMARPRELAESRHDPEFVALHRAIWAALKDEVMKAYGNAV